MGKEKRDVNNCKRMRMRKHIIWIILLIVMVMASCSSEKSISTNIHKDGLLSLFSEFTIVTLPIEVDSLSLPFFIKEIQKRKRIDKYWVDKIGIKSSSKITQGQNRYAYYKYGPVSYTHLTLPTKRIV